MEYLGSQQGIAVTKTSAEAGPIQSLPAHAQLRPQPQRCNIRVSRSALHSSSHADIQRKSLASPKGPTKVKPGRALGVILECTQGSS